MATLADVTAKWQTRAKDGLTTATKDAKTAKEAADKAATAVKEVQTTIAGLVIEESALLASLDDAPSPADLDDLNAKLVKVRRDLRSARSDLTKKNGIADDAARAALRAQAAVATAGYELAVATGAAKDAEGLATQVSKLTKAIGDEPVKLVHDRAKAAQAAEAELDRATQHIKEQIGQDLLTLAQAQADAVRAETDAARSLLEGAGRAHAIIGDESDIHDGLLASIAALAQYAESAVARLDSAISRLKAIADSTKSSPEAIAALGAVVVPDAAQHLAEERSLAEVLTAAEAGRMVAKWYHDALVIAKAADADVAAAQAILDTATATRDTAAAEHTAKLGGIPNTEKQAQTTWNDAVPITLWPLLTALLEASATVNDLAACDPAALITDVTNADSKAADAVNARLDRSKQIQDLGLDLDGRAGDLVAAEASQSARLATALNT
jgi:hypothetical protein